MMSEMPESIYVSENQNKMRTWYEACRLQLDGDDTEFVRRDVVEREMEKYQSTVRWRATAIIIVVALIVLIDTMFVALRN